MKTPIRTFIACLIIAGFSMAATPKSTKRLTVQRVIELIAPTDAPKGYLIEVSGLGSFRFAAPKSGDAAQLELEKIREYRYPTDFDPPSRTGDGLPPLTPSTPTAFETIKAGWTLRVSARLHGQLVTIAGAADYVTVESLPGGYGAVSGPIYADNGTVVTPNLVLQPKIQTTTTHFQIFALPGESYAVTLYRGDQREQHTFTVKRQ